MVESDTPIAAAIALCVASRCARCRTVETILRALAAGSADDGDMNTITKRKRPGPRPGRKRAREQRAAPAGRKAPRLGPAANDPGSVGPVGRDVAGRSRHPLRRRRGRAADGGPVHVRAQLFAAHGAGGGGFDLDGALCGNGGPAGHPLRDQPLGHAQAIRQRGLGQAVALSEVVAQVHGPNISPAK